MLFYLKFDVYVLCICWVGILHLCGHRFIYFTKKVTCYSVIGTIYFLLIKKIKSWEKTKNKTFPLTLGAVLTLSCFLLHLLHVAVGGG